MTTNLSGSLSEFSLAEVLTLLGMGGRTARMQVTSPGAVGTVHMVDGRLSSATADSARAGLLRRIVAALPVPADDLAHALDAEDPVRALVGSGVVDRDAAQRAAAEHCTESVGEMLSWTSGEFAVWVGSEDPSDIGVRLEVEELVGAARQRAQEWADLRAALPESDTVLALVPDVDQAPVVEVDDWAILARVDGRATLAEVLAAMGASPLAAGNRLVQLMGRGLVAVRDEGGDADQEHANELLAAFEAGGGIGPVGHAEGVIEVGAPDSELADPEADAAAEVHDLFVTEPGAVEEWQDAAGEAWIVAVPRAIVDVDEDRATSVVEERVELSEWAALVAPGAAGHLETLLAESLPAEAEPRTYELEPVDFATGAATFDVGMAPLQPATVDFDMDPVAYVVEPVAHERASEPEPEPAPAATPAPESVAAPGTLDVAPVAEVAPVALEVVPVAEPVAESFAWSPWAQEMGLGEAPVAAPVPEPATFGFADMVEDGGGHGHTDAFPVPQAPITGFASEPAPEVTPVAEPEVDQVGQVVPQPREPGDGILDPATYAQDAGAHPAASEYREAPAAVESDTAAEEPRGEAPDPLAGGLLAHLMSSVRGL